MLSIIQKSAIFVYKQGVYKQGVYKQGVYIFSLLLLILDRLKSHDKKHYTITHKKLKPQFKSIFPYVI